MTKFENRKNAAKRLTFLPTFQVTLSFFTLFKIQVYKSIQKSNLVISVPANNLKPKVKQ